MRCPIYEVLNSLIYDWRTKPLRGGNESSAFSGQDRAFSEFWKLVRYFHSIYFLGSVQLLFLGIIGEYVFRIYTETQRRPLFIIDEFIE